MHLRPWAFVALLVSLLAAGPLSADEVALRISLHQPADGLLGQNLQEFKKMVEAETKGAVKVSIYDKASFYLDYQVPEGVSSGAIEMGVAPLAAYTDEIPPAGLFMQPFLFNFDAIVRAASARGSEIRKLIDAEIEKEGGGQGAVVAALRTERRLRQGEFGRSQSDRGAQCPGVR